MSDVKVSVTFRHTHSTEALKQYAEEKILKLGKYFYRAVDAHVVLSIDAHKRHMAEITLQGRHVTLHGSEETKDLYSAIDKVTDKMEQQIRKHKTKLQRRRVKTN